jgi:lysylphosphatidylglycerol synthetase-like protein (DUF2156 family)
MIAALTMVALTLTLWVADDSGARPVEALRYFVPVLLIDALLALVAVPLVRLLLRTQGIRAQRAGYRVIGRAHAGR